MNAQIEKLEHGLMICEATGTKLVHIEKADAEKIIGLLKDQESAIEALKSDLAETLEVLAQRPEIVLCKDCTFRNEINCPQYYRRSELPDDWFCADGERKD